MSEIKRFDIPRDGNEFLHEDPDGEYVQYDDHRAEVERLAAALTEAHERCGALELAVEQADEMKAHAEASAAAEEAETDRVTAERDAAQAEVERLRANGQGMLDSSRPTDEDIWLKLWLHSMPDFGERDAAEMAEGALAEYRKRWPR